MINIKPRNNLARNNILYGVAIVLGLILVAVLFMYALWWSWM